MLFTEREDEPEPDENVAEKLSDYSSSN